MNHLSKRFQVIIVRVERQYILHNVCHLLQKVVTFLISLWTTGEILIHFSIVPEIDTLHSFFCCSRNLKTKFLLALIKMLTDTVWNNVDVNLLNKLVSFVTQAQIIQKYFCQMASLMSLATDINLNRTKFSVYV